MTTALLHLFTSTRRACSPERGPDPGKASGFTLVELMVAMCVSLMLLGGVVSLFGTLGESVNDSKSNSEMLQTMRHAARQLQSDLGNVSLVPDPAQTMVDPQGFFEYVEGPANDHVPYSDSDEPEEVQLPDPIILDVAAAEATGNWSFNSAASLSCYASNNKRQYNHSMGNKSVKWTKTLEPGKYQVSMTWPTDWKFHSDGTPKWPDLHFWAVPVTISSGDNSQTVDVDQTQKPSDLADPEATRAKDGDPIMWHHLGQIDVGDDGQLAVQIGPYQRPQGEAANKQVYADAIRIECLELTGGGGGGGDNTEVADSLPLMGDCDDVLHFTTKTDEGAHEVVWFLTPMKGHENKSVTDKRYRLHRVIRAIVPNATTADDRASAIPIATLAWNNLTLRAKTDGTGEMEKTPSSLQDLALRENRFAHEKRYDQNGETPRDKTGSPPDSPGGEPNPDGIVDCFNVVTAKNYQETLIKDSLYMDDWDPDNPKDDPRETGEQRLSRTVVLENVIAFNVQAYDPSAPVYATPTTDEQTVSLVPNDPGYGVAADSGEAPIGMGAFADLGYRAASGSPTISDFSNSASGNVKQDADGNASTRAYDSWSGNYVKTFDHDGDSSTEEVPGDVGFDNDGNGIVDTAEDLREPPPYDAPLKAVQVEIRMQEPESGKVRSVKVRKFLGKR